ncbi:MAG: epoxyqueuosine reductase [Tissierellia bacterium]|nr:epoxyqueuosine reductase [Tissierellia bacterium]
MLMTSNKIKRRALELGAQGCGIAGIKRFENAPEGFSPKDIFSKCKSVISFYKVMPAGAILAENPIPYTHASYQMYKEVDEISMGLLRFCQDFNINGVIIPSDTPYIYWDEDNMEGKGILSLKHTAVLAGLGIMGHNTIFMNSQYGNMPYLGAILVDDELEEDDLTNDFSCIPGCRKCIKACPVGAIEIGKVDQKLCREQSFYKVGRGWDTYNCSECRTKCPLHLGNL